MEGVIANTGFDAYTQKNKPYKNAFNYLNDPSAKSNGTLEKLRAAVAPIYLGTERDTTNGAILYYSPKAQASLHLSKPSLYTRSTPNWVNSKVQEVTIKGTEKDDFKFYRYK